jgi:hypothetical protein
MPWFLIQTLKNAGCFIRCSAGKRYHITVLSAKFLALKDRSDNNWRPRNAPIITDGPRVLAGGGLIFFLTGEKRFYKGLGG